MATLAKASDAIGHNGFDGEKLKGYIGKIEGYFGEMESSKASHMKRCRELRDSMDVVYEEAKALGIPKKVLRTHVKIRELETKKRQAIDKLGEDETDSFERIAEALGDFAGMPLGAAALERAKVHEATADADAAALSTLAAG